MAAAWRTDGIQADGGEHCSPLSARTEVSLASDALLPGHIAERQGLNSDPVLGAMIGSVSAMVQLLTTQDPCHLQRGAITCCGGRLSLLSQELAASTTTGLPLFPAEDALGRSGSLKMWLRDMHKTP